MIDIKDKEQIKKIVREVLTEDEKELKLNLIERIVRVEEGIKNLSEQIKLILETTNKRFDDLSTQIKLVLETTNKRFDDVNNRFDDVNNRFDDVNNRFDDINKRFDRQTWLITAGFAFLSILITLITIFAK